MPLKLDDSFTIDCVFLRTFYILDFMQLHGLLHPYSSSHQPFMSPTKNSEIRLSFIEALTHLFPAF